MRIQNWTRFTCGLGGASIAAGGAAVSLSYLFNGATSSPTLLAVGAAANIGVLIWATSSAIQSVDLKSPPKPLLPSYPRPT